MKDENENFSNFLSELYDECEKLYILLTSNVTLDALPNQIVPEVQYVESLRSSSAAQLFFDRSGEFTTQDIFEWIMSDAKYPYDKLLTQSADKKLLTLIQDRMKVKDDADETNNFIRAEIIKKIN